MPRPQETNYQERIARHLASRADAIAQDISSRFGRASNAQEIPPDKELEMWNYKRRYTEDGRELIPREVLGQLLDQGMPLEDAMTAVVDQVYPLRRRMVAHGRPNPQDRIEYAERMNKRSEQFYNQDSEESETQQDSEESETPED